MRRKLALFALPASFILGICAQIVWLSWPGSCCHEPESLQGSVAADYEVSGYYYPAQEFPLAFITVRRIDLTTSDFRVNSDSVIRMPITPMGRLITEFDVYKLSDVNTDGGRISFTTEPRFGVSYQFAGRVLKEGDYPIQGFLSQYYVGKTIMVEGRMVKMLFGFKVAQGEVRFTRGTGC